MLGKNLNVEMRIGGRKCKVRKRGCSSSSSSSLVQNYKLKRAFVLRKRVGSSTPVPLWKMNGSKSPCLEFDHGFKYVAAKGGENAKDFSVSARKLAATLWEINGLLPPRTKMENMEDKTCEMGIVRKERIFEPNMDSMALALSDQFQCPVSERMDPSKVGRHRNQVSSGSQKLLLPDHTLGRANSFSDCLVEVDPKQNHIQSSCKHLIVSKTHLKDIYNGLTTSKELLKLLSRIWPLDQQNSTSLSLVSALKLELDLTCTHFNQYMLERRTNQSDVDNTLRHFLAEKVVWKLKEQDRIQSAVTSLSNELKIEKRLRKQTEKLNKKLGKELAETKASLSRATKDLERERRAREIMEQVCDELARGIGEDKVEVEELKRESVKVQKEVEKEREMLHLADVLREERAQMKLLEAKYQFEEKNAVVDKLRNELELFLKSKNEEDYSSPRYEKIKALERHLRETLPGSYQFQEHENDQDPETVDKVEENEEDDDSDDSDLHSIELSVDELNKTIRWNGSIKNEAKRNSFDRSKGTKPTSENIKKPTISSQAKFADGIEWELTTNNQGNFEVFDKNVLFEFASKSWKRDAEDEIERYNMIKDLRDNIVSGTRMVSSQEFAGPS
ncbi:uncharacterized protein At5g41620-like [Primulina huaijiensis]|uniref:uncharacterized protein At5g41620-like n=1 Tax=Primulina huaijiensis TaxID=1492673 RepID=UPI003CC75E5A